MAGETRMSTIQANAILDASGGNTTTINGVTPNTNTVRGRNLIINGAMQVAQRGTSQTASSSSAFWGVDRFAFQTNANTNSTVEQSTDVPTNQGFKYSLKLTNGSAYTPTGSDFGRIYTRLEGYDVNHMNFGTASSSAFTLSFWVKSSLTGTFGGIFGGNGNGIYVFNYSISVSNTWEKKTITVPAGTITTYNGNTTNGQGWQISWDMGEGPDRSNTAGWHSNQPESEMGLTSGTKVVSTANATWQITGVKLEVGSVATEFDHRSFAEELSLCQRYFFNPLFGRTSGTIYYPIHFNQVSTGNNGLLRWQVTFPVSMRTSPSLTHSLTDAKFQSSGAPDGTDNWAFYRQNSGWSAKAGNSNISVLNIAPSVNQANVGAYYVTPNDTLATAIGIGGGATFNFSSEL